MNESVGRTHLECRISQFVLPTRKNWQDRRQPVVDLQLKCGTSALGNEERDEGEKEGKPDVGGRRFR